MKEKEVYLTQNEIDYLLKGQIHWEDIQSRVDVPFRRTIEPSNEKSSHQKEPLEHFILDESPKREFREPLEEVQSDEDTELLYDLLRNNKGANKPFLEGNKVYLILLIIGTLTIGTWAYFVFTQ